MPVNFVKFQRGVQSAYNTLKTAGRLDAETLYFIYNDPNDVDAGGKLYLGERLIGGAGSGDTVTSLGDLTDVNLAALATAQEPDGMILQFDSTTDKWIATSIKTAIEQSGASLTKVLSGTKTEEQTLENFLNTIDADKKTGDIVFVSGVPYIYDGSEWKPLTSSTLDGRVSDLEDRMTAVETGLQAVDGKISQAISTANHLQYNVPTNGVLPEITTANVGSLKNTIFLIPNNETSGNDRYEEYMFIGDSTENGRYEKLGNWAADLDGYVTTATFNTTVSDLQNSISGLQSVVNNIDLSQYVTVSRYESEVGSINTLRTATGDNTSTVVNELIDLRNRLQWTAIE